MESNPVVEIRMFLLAHEICATYNVGCTNEATTEVETHPLQAPSFSMGASRKHNVVLILLDMYLMIGLIPVLGEYEGFFVQQT